MTRHTVRAFDEELVTLTNIIRKMGELAEAMFVDVLEAFPRQDMVKAKQIIEQDAQLDQLHHEVEEAAVLLIARRQPMANDLRHVLGTIRIATDIERIGDLVKNVAKRVIIMEDRFLGARSLPGIQQMARLVLEQLTSVLTSFSQRNADIAQHVWLHDGEVDTLHNSLFRELLTYMMEDPRSITYSTHLLFIAKNIERVGDHTTNIAETVYFIETGKHLYGPRPKGEVTAFISSPEKNNF